MSLSFFLYIDSITRRCPHHFFFTKSIWFVHGKFAACTSLYHRNQSEQPNMIVLLFLYNQQVKPTTPHESVSYYVQSLFNFIRPFRLKHGFFSRSTSLKLIFWNTHSDGRPQLRIKLYVPRWYDAQLHQHQFTVALSYNSYLMTLILRHCVCYFCTIPNLSWQNSLWTKIRLWRSSFIFIINWPDGSRWASLADPISIHFTKKKTKFTKQNSHTYLLYNTISGSQICSEGTCKVSTPP